MMKKTALIVAILLVASAVSAQEIEGVRKGAIELGIAGGLNFPVGDYADISDISGTVDLVLGFYTSPKFALGIDIGVHWMRPTDSAWQWVADSINVSDPEVKLRVYRLLTPYVKYLFKQTNFSPYLTGLVGLYLQELKVTGAGIGNPNNPSISNTFTEGYLGFALGAGVQWVMPESAIIFLDGRFHSAMRDGRRPITFIDVRVGLAFAL